MNTALMKVKPLPSEERQVTKATARRKGKPTPAMRCRLTSDSNAEYVAAPLSVRLQPCSDLGGCARTLPPSKQAALGLQNTLEDIHDIARFDRHRRLRIVGIYPRNTEVGITTEPRGGGVSDYEWIEDWDVFSGKYDFLRIKVRLPGDLIPHDIRLKTKMSFEPAFESVRPYGGDDAGTNIHRFIQGVERVIARFDEEFLTRIDPSAA